MKLVDVSCPHCGANMKITDNARTVHCDYCNHDFLIDDEVIQINHRFENAEQAGYEFEKGRQRYKDEEDVIQFDARCPLCGELFYEDYRAKRTVCPYCYKEVDAEIAFALSKAVWYENMEQPLEALAKYNQVLKSYPKCQTAIDGRERVKPKANTHNAIGCLGVSIVLLVILMFAVMFFVCNRAVAEAYALVCLFLAGDSALPYYRRIARIACLATGRKTHSLGPWHPYHALRQYVQSLAMRTGRTAVCAQLAGNAFDICGRHWFCS